MIEFDQLNLKHCVLQCTYDCIMRNPDSAISRKNDFRIVNGVMIIKTNTKLQKLIFTLR